MYFFKALLFTSLLMVTSCGLFNPKFEEYEEDSETASGPSDPSTECGAAALQTFSTEIGTVIDSTCGTSGCHGGGKGSLKISLQPGQADDNREKIFAFTGLSAKKLADFVASPQLHQGGDQSQVLPLTKISAWTDKETECLAR